MSFLPSRKLVFFCVFICFIYPVVSNVNQKTIETRGLFPKNVTDWYKGDWKLEEQHDAMKMFAQSSGESSVRIVNQVGLSDHQHAVEGELWMKDGVWSEDYDWRFSISGYYAFETGDVVALVIPYGSLLRFTTEYIQTHFLKPQPTPSNTTVNSTAAAAQPTATTSSGNSDSEIFEIFGSTDSTGATVIEPDLASVMEFNQNVIGMNETAIDRALELLKNGSLEVYWPQQQYLDQLSANLPKAYTPSCITCVYKMHFKFQPGIPERTQFQKATTQSDPNEYLYDDDGQNDPKHTQQHMSGRIVSGSCNITASVDMSSFLYDQYFSKVSNYTLMVCIMTMVQLYLLIKQMDYTNTQTTASRVSLLTVGAQSILDSYLCLLHLTSGIVMGPVFSSFATAAFLKFVLFSVFEMRYLLSIWKARRPQQFAEGWQSVRRELSTLYTRFYGFLLLGIVLVYNLNGFTVLYVIGLYSFWIPQIVVNVKRDCKKPMTPQYIIGTTLTRLAIPLYFFGCPKNFLSVKPSLPVTLFIIIHLGWQCAALLLQYRFGPRFFIPKMFLPKKYDYYRPLPASLRARLHSRRVSLVLSEPTASAEGGAAVPPAVAVDEVSIQMGDMSADHTPTTSPQDVERTSLLENGERSEHAHQPADEENQNDLDCVICMSEIDPSPGQYMITPCNHVFHTECLEQWLDVKLICPTCRRTLPER